MTKVDEFVALMLAFLNGMPSSTPAPIKTENPVIEGQLLKVLDGDTIDILVKGEKIRIRFAGIDAFEKQQWCYYNNGFKYQCGINSKDALTKLIVDKNIRCELFGKDNRDERAVGICYSNNINLNSKLVENGWAVGFMSTKKVNFCGFEDLAVEKKTGAWVGYFDLPEKYRGRKVDLKDYCPNQRTRWKNQ